MKKIVMVLYFIILGLFLVLVYRTNRALYTSAFDAEYWTDKFEHSQWRLADSGRVIGDDGLYLVEGYRVIGGADPTASSAEVPPLGKYLIGLSVKYLGNGYLYGYITTALAVLSAGLLTWTLSSSYLASIGVMALTAVDPLIASQFELTMLDSVQFLFLALSLAAFILYIRSKKFGWGLVVLSGVFLGLFSASKIPVLSPVIATVYYLALRKKQNGLSHFAALIGSAVAGYLVPYIPYFLQGHTPIEWFTVQTYIVSFYRKGLILPNFGSVITTLLVNQGQNLFSRAWVTIPEWTPMWPVSVMGTFFWVRSLQKKQAHTMPLAATLSGIILIYLVVPFWTRYLVIIVPLLYIGTVLYLRHKIPKIYPLIILVLIGINLIMTIRILFPTPDAAFRQFSYDWSHGYFHDMYERIAPSVKTTDRDAFNRFGQKIFYDARIESVTISTDRIRWNRWWTQQTVPISVIYRTRDLGTFTHQTSITMVKEQGQWRVAWQWNNLLEGLTTDLGVKTKVDPAKRGSIMSSNGDVLTRDEESVMIWVDPSQTDPARENNMLTLLNQLFDNRVPAYRLHNRYVENPLPESLVPVGVVMKPLLYDARRKLLEYPGIMLTPAYGRFADPTATSEVGSVANTQFTECCSLLYNTTSYDGVTGLEKTYNDTLKGINGGSLVLVNRDGQVIRTIIDVKRKDGEDVLL